MILPVTLTPQQIEPITWVNADVDYLPYKNDVALYGLLEFWQRISVMGEGDCEDFSLEKWFRLFNLGIPRSNLMLGTCLTETAEDHAVLVVAHAPGIEVVLDQRQGRVVPMSQWFATPAEGGLGNFGKLIQVPGEMKWQHWKMVAA